MVERRPLLTLSGVDAGYNASRILHGVDLEVREGEVVALLGRNGVGKTTTLHTIMGLLKPTRGTITFDSHDITSSFAGSDQPARHRHCTGGAPDLSEPELSLRILLWLSARVAGRSTTSTSYFRNCACVKTRAAKT